MVDVWRLRPQTHCSSRARRRYQPSHSGIVWRVCAVGPPAFLRLGQQRLVVLLRGLVRQRADDLGDVAVQVAVAPGAEPLVADHVGQGARRVAPGVALVEPVLLVLVVVLAGEEVHRQRRDAGRRRQAHGLSGAAATATRRHPALAPWPRSRARRSPTRRPPPWRAAAHFANPTARPRYPDIIEAFLPSACEPVWQGCYDGARERSIGLRAPGPGPSALTEDRRLKTED